LNIQKAKKTIEADVKKIKALFKERKLFTHPTSYLRVGLKKVEKLLYLSHLEIMS